MSGTVMTSAEGALSLTVRLSDEDVERVAGAIVKRLADRVPDWLPERPMTPEETADFLGVAVGTLRRWRREGALVPFTYGQTILYTPDQIAAFLAGGRHDE